MHYRNLKTSVLLLAFATVLLGGQTTAAKPFEDSDALPKQIDLGGYGELHFSQPDGSTSGVIDLHRFVIFLGSDLGPKTRLFTEIEFEHSEKIEMEQAYLEYSLGSKWALRAGLLLVPVGWINLHHEPPVFHGVERPAVDTVILPTTWREGGASLVYKASEYVRVEAAVLSGLDASLFEANTGIREGRGGAAETQADDISYALRLDASPLMGIDLGFSGYWGEADQQSMAIQGAAVGLAAGYFTVERAGFRFRGQAGVVHLREALKIALLTGENLAQDMIGYYLEASYDLFQNTSHGRSLSPFLRFERIDLQNKMARGMSGDPVLDTKALEFGLSFMLSSQAVFKADYQWSRNKVPGSKVQGILSLGAGWSF